MKSGDDGPTNSVLKIHRNCGSDPVSPFKAGFWIWVPAVCPGYSFEHLTATPKMASLISVLLRVIDNMDIDHFSNSAAFLTTPSACPFSCSLKWLLDRSSQLQNGHLVQHEWSILLVHFSGTQHGMDPDRSKEIPVLQGSFMLVSPIGVLQCVQ